MRIYFSFKTPNLLITISGQRCEFFLMCVNQRHQFVTIEQVQIRLRKTFDSSATPKPGLDGYFRSPCSLDASPIDAF